MKIPEAVESDTKELNDTELNDALLEPAEPAEPAVEPLKAITNKKSIIDRINRLSSDHNIPIPHSPTKLKRMSKKQLHQLLSDMVEQGIKRDMAAKLGTTSTDDRSLAIGALRMVHDICAKGLETGLNMYLPQYGYGVEGFTEGLRDPTVSTQIDSCLLEIATENEELLEYIKSPYARLGLCWMGALSFSIKRKAIKKNVARMEPRPTRGKDPVQPSVVRRPADGKVDSHGRARNILPV